MPATEDSPADDAPNLGGLVALGLCCHPGPFGAAMTPEWSDSISSRLSSVGIQVVLLGLMIWMIIRWWRTQEILLWRANLVIYPIVGLWILLTGVQRIRHGAPPIETQRGVPDWGYQLDGAISCVLGIIVLVLCARDIARHKRQRSVELA
ncbi:hypothetical protein ABT304_09655 [Nocardioides sp. NPDC000445]|uniref:hypothetical protein n=1 Tax=Nocardioides sp. NPDC000445 TaxID=3154257 RepID=UPI00331EAEC9